MNFNFVGKNFVVTGAGRGIGVTVVKELMKYGAKVIAVDNKEKDLQELKQNHPSLLRIIATDISDWNLTREALSDLDEVDGLVNNARIASAPTPFIDASLEDLDKCVDVNVRGVLNVSQLVAQKMVDQGEGGSIVIMSSQGSIAAVPDQSIYCATKAAVEHMMHVMALELYPFDIRVNCVSPTVTGTSIGRAQWNDPGKKAEMLSKIPIGRFPEYKEITNSILYLLSNLSLNTTGVSIAVDGGELTLKSV